MLQHEAEKLAGAPREIVSIEITTAIRDTTVDEILPQLKDGRLALEDPDEYRRLWAEHQRLWAEGGEGTDVSHGGPSS